MTEMIYAPPLTPSFTFSKANDGHLVCVIETRVVNGDPKPG